MTEQEHIQHKETVEALRWKKTPVLDDGFVCLVDIMGNDEDIVQAARVSYNKHKRDGDTTANDSDETLLRYLMRHTHTTPFEMVEIKFLVRVPMDCWRQWIRHRMASVNEYSTRYTTAIDARQETPVDEWRLQSANNKQGSSGLLQEWPATWRIAQDSENKSVYRIYDADGNFITEWSSEHGAPTPGQLLTAMELGHHAQAESVYKMRLALGVAKEQARKDLPLSTYTEAYWKIDLHNLMHFLRLRMDSHAQLEIRMYANAIAEIVQQLVPRSFAAFEDYVINSMRLTTYDQQIIQNLIGSGVSLPAAVPAYDSNIWPDNWRDKPRFRERDESIAKLRRLFVLAPEVGG